MRSDWDWNQCETKYIHSAETCCVFVNHRCSSLHRLEYFMKWKKKFANRSSQILRTGPLIGAYRSYIQCINIRLCMTYTYTGVSVRLTTKLSQGKCWKQVCNFYIKRSTWQILVKIEAEVIHFYKHTLSWIISAVVARDRRDWIQNSCHLDSPFCGFTNNCGTVLASEKPFKDKIPQQWTFSHYLLTTMLIEIWVSFVIGKTFLELHKKTVLQHSPKQQQQNIKWLHAGCPA